MPEKEPGGAHEAYGEPGRKTRYSPLDLIIPAHVIRRIARFKRVTMTGPVGPAAYGAKFDGVKASRPPSKDVLDYISGIESHR